jgi:hypothetical protein
MTANENITIMFRGREFSMGTTLRVAYLVQGQHNHKPYLQIFEGLGEMVLEDQIGILWASFKCANAQYVTDSGLKRSEFQEDLLDNYNLGEMMELLKKVIGGIMGEDMDKDTAEEKVKDVDELPKPSVDEDDDMGNIHASE